MTNNMTPAIDNSPVRKRLVDELKPEWAKFVWGIAEGLDPTTAYQRAYPAAKSEAGAYASARRLLSNARICEAIGEVQEDILEANIWYLRALQRKALQVLEKAVDSGDIQAAQDLLDRTGLIPRRGLEIATGRGRELDQFLQDGD